MGSAASRDRREPPCRLVSFEATDGIALAGLLYEPSRRTKRAVVFLHGTGGASVFDSRRTNLLAHELLVRGFAFLPFDNRGSHLVRRMRQQRGRHSRSVGGGMAFERIRDCVADIDGAVRFLRSRGFTELFLAGHSTGANKIAVYDHYKKRSPFKKYVLLAGGDDTGMLYAQLGVRRFRAALRRARAMLAARRGDELVPPSLSTLPMSWRSLLDMINPDGDYNVFPFLEAMRGIRLGRRRPFRHVRGIRRPALYLYGERDEYCFGDVPRCVSILAGEVAGNAELAILEDAGHGFRGFEPELGALIAEWLAEAPVRRSR
jgi:pimeloyl-ACP methyl ester carboxylesterase